jgi:transcriptional regulator with XRE-family HTH domain
MGQRGPIKPRGKRGTRHEIVIARNLREFRKASGMTQKQVGKHLGVSLQQVQKYENASNRLTGGRIIELCKLLDITPHDLMGWE